MIEKPVIFYRCNGCGHAYEQMHPTSCDCNEAGGFDRVEYFTAPAAQRQWVGLTDEEIQTAWGSVMDGAVFTRKEVYKAIEAKLKEKNNG
jgi:hypothetical protein